MLALSIFNQMHTDLCNNGHAWIAGTASRANDLKMILAQKRRENPEFFEMVLSVQFMAEHLWTRNERGGNVNRIISLRWRGEKEKSRSAKCIADFGRMQIPLPPGFPGTESAQRNENISGPQPLYTPEEAEEFRKKHERPFDRGAFDAFFEKFSKNEEGDTK